MQDSDIIKKLGSFGINSVEANVYLYLLGKSAMPVLDISRELKLPRTTVYDAITHLMELGLLERIVEYKTQRFRAHPVEVLQSLIDGQKATTDELTANLAYLQAQLAPSPHLTTHTEVRYYHGAEGFRQMMWHALEAKGEHVGYSELGRIDVVGKKFSERWMEEMITRKIRDRVIVNPKKETLAHLSELAGHEFRRIYQTTRTIPENTMHISGDTTIYNNTFAVAWWKKGEVVGVEIENPELVKTQASMFDILWSLAKPLKKQ